MTSAHLHMDLDTLLEGEVMDICTKEMDNLRVSDLEDTVVEDPEPGSAEEYDRAAAIAARKEAAKTGRRKKKKTASSTSLASNTFQELYRLTGEVLGQGAYAIVQTCVNIYTEVEYAVKIIDKVPGHSRARVFKEIDLFHHVQGHKNIIQLIEYFEEPERFYLIFEKVSGGQLLDHIQRRKFFTEQEAARKFFTEQEAAPFFFTSLACTLSKKSFLHWLCFTCSTRTQILLGKILPPTRLLTTTPTARLETLNTRPVLPW